MKDTGEVTERTLADNGGERFTVGQFTKRKLEKRKRRIALMAAFRSAAWNIGSTRQQIHATRQP